MNKKLAKYPLSGVPRTLLFTLRARADEQTHAAPLFSDPLAVQWSQSLPWDEELKAIYRSPLQIVFAVRAYHYDRLVSRHIASHPQAVVVELGAGLSTRYQRIGSNAYRWLDLDLPAVTDLRRQLDAETERHQFISKSVLDFSWLDAVPEVSSENILFLAEGLLMYLEPREVREIINRLRSRFPGATLLADVLGHIIAKGGRGAKQLERIGAPFKWSVTDEGDVAAMGLSIVSVSSLANLCQGRLPLLLDLLSRSLSWLPLVRNSYLIVEAKVKPRMRNEG